MDTILLIAAIAIGILLGLGLGRWWLSERTRESETSTTEIVNALINALGPQHHGVAVLDEHGDLAESNDLLSTILGYEVPAPPNETSPVPLADWARNVVPDDLEAIKAWTLDPALRTTPLSIRLQSGDEVRWLRLIYIRSSPTGHTTLLIEETETVEHARRERIALRNATATVEITDVLTSAETLEIAIADVLAILNERFDLRSSTWCSIHPETSEIAEVASNRTEVDHRAALPGDIVESMKDPSGRLAGGLPLILGGSDERLLLPILTNAQLSDILVLHATRPDTWDAETAEQLMVIADKMGRRMEQYIGEEQREAWASTRGSLERAEAIAQMTGSIAHDFNGILFAIQGRLELLRAEIGEGSVQSDVDEIENAVVEAKRLAERLRSALRGDQDPIPINVASEIETIVENARRLLPSSLDLTCNIHPSVRETQVILYAPANALEQILMHLLVNARDALGGHGRVMLGVRLNAEDRLEIRIDDDGPGIPAEDRDRLVEPYETGESSVGTGLGLAICKRLVIQRQGDFRLLDSPLGGLAVSMEFPIRLTRPRDATPPSSTGHRTPSRVLVVEDNTIIRDVLARVFQGAETQVDARGDASEVEKILSDHPETDLLIFDIDLPGRTGIECLQDLRSQGIDIPCLLITGGITEPPALDRIAFLRKPFRIDVLRRTASQLLEQPAG